MNREEKYVIEERSLPPTRKNVLMGVVDVVFWRFERPQLVVAGDTTDAVTAVGHPPRAGLLAPASSDE